MFSKRCSRCESKVKNEHKFCPSCGFDMGDKFEKDDYGILGRNDSGLEDSMSFSDNFMEKMFNSALKVLDKQMRSLNSEMKAPYKQNKSPRHPVRRRNNPGFNVQFFVNGERVFSDNDMTNQPVKIANSVSKEKLKKFSGLPKKEPKSKIKRLSDRVIYELSVPGVDSIEDVLINQLESSVEIKVLSKEVVYSKNLNVNLPILRYHLVKDNLIIEMQAK